MTAGSNPLSAGDGVGGVVDTPLQVALCNYLEAAEHEQFAQGRPFVKSMRINHLEQVDELLSREPMALPKLEFVDADDLKGLDGLINFKFENLKLENYQSWGKIAAPVAV